jgi:hypothetical protein
MRKFSIFLLILTTVLSGCSVFSKRIRGNGEIRAENRTVSSFQSVRVSGAIDIYVSTDSQATVRVETDANLLDYVVTETEGNTLSIHPRSGARLRPSNSIKVYVTNAVFERLRASGACNIISQNKLAGAEELEVNLSGACEVNLDVQVPSVEVKGSGSTNVILRGATRDLRISGSGSTEVHAYDLLSENTSVKLSGAGDAEVFASVKLDVHVSGAGDVRYKGNAAVSQSISGAGSVKKTD